MGAYTRVAATHFNGFDAPKPYYIMDEKTWEAIYGAPGRKSSIAKRGGSGAKKARLEVAENGQKDRDTLKGQIDEDIEHQIVALFK